VSLSYGAAIASSPEPSVTEEREFASVSNHEQNRAAPPSEPGTVGERFEPLREKEPTVDDTIEAALAFSHSSGMNYERMLRRARRANWLPQRLRVGAVYRRDRENEWRYHVDQSFDSFDVLEETGVDDRLLDQTDTYFEVRVQLEWSLSELRQSADEVALRRLQQRAEEDRAKLAELVLDVYFERRIAQMAYLERAPSLEPGDSYELLIEVERLTAILDELTGGWFSQQITEP
jgi:hypothetical protein